jgi:hypothetical protein
MKPSVKAFFDNRGERCHVDGNVDDLVFAFSLVEPQVLLSETPKQVGAL